MNARHGRFAASCAASGPIQWPRLIGALLFIGALCSGCQFNRSEGQAIQVKYIGRGEPMDQGQQSSRDGPERRTRARRGGQGRSMRVVSYIVVAKVVDFKPPEAGRDATLRLQGAPLLHISKSNPFLDIWESMVAEMQAAGRPVYVEYNVDTREVLQMYQPLLMRVDHIAAKPEGDRLVMGLRMSPSLSYLRTTAAGFAQMRRLAEESLKQKTQVLVTTHGPEILDMRRP